MIRMLCNVRQIHLRLYHSAHMLTASPSLGRAFRFQRLSQGKGNGMDGITNVKSEVADASPVSPLKRAKTELAPEHFKPVLKFAKLSENATTPTRGSTKAAGYDLYSAYDYSISPMDKAIVKTDLQIAVPTGYYGRVAPRSGLAAKHFIDVGAGVVDEDYRGNVGVVLFNFSKETFEVKKGDRIAQLVCEKICYPDLMELETLEETERGAGGFGSTGRN